MRSKSSGTRAVRLTPSEVGERIRTEHQQLRRLLVQLQVLARSAALDPEELPALERAMGEVIVEFSSHIESEERTLLPLIERLQLEESAERPIGGSWVERLDREYTEQRELLREMRAVSEITRSSTQVASTLLAEAADGFVLGLLRAMRNEEQELDVLLGDRLTAATA